MSSKTYRMSSKVATVLVWDIMGETRNLESYDLTQWEKDFCRDILERTVKEYKYLTTAQAIQLDRIFNKVMVIDWKEVKHAEKPKPKILLQLQRAFNYVAGICSKKRRS